VKWTRFTVDNAAETKTRADSTQVKTALAFELNRAGEMRVYFNLFDSAESIPDQQGLEVLDIQHAPPEYSLPTQRLALRFPKARKSMPSSITWSLCLMSR
jgi:hypothetical protein